MAVTHNSPAGVVGLDGIDEHPCSDVMVSGKDGFFNLEFQVGEDGSVVGAGPLQFGVMPPLNDDGTVAE